MLLLSAWLVVLHHWSEQEDLVVGILVSGRELGGDRYMVGHCVDVVPFRSRVTVETCVADFLADVRQRVLGAFEHRGFTLGDWADLAANATWPPVPTVTTCFNLEPRLGGAGERSPSASPELVPFEQPVVFAKFELGLNIADTGDELQLDCEYDPAAFTKASVERLLARYMNAVRHVSSGDEDARLADLDLIGVPERAEAIALAQGTACAATHALPSVVAQIAARVAERPHAVALRIGEDEVTFGAMAARAAQVGALLNQRGTIPEARVGLVLERSAAFVVAALGAMQSGAAFVPLDPRLPDMRLAGMLSDAAATTVLTTPDRVAPLRAALLDVGSSCDIVALEPDGQLNHASRSAANHEPALAMSDVTVHPDQSAYVIYTSGSTGQPKGVAVTHDGFRNFVHWCREAFAITAADRTACLCGEGFDAVVQELWPALCAGGSVQILPQLLPPDELRDWLIAHEIALAYVPAPVGEAILGLPADWERGTIRVLGLGGDRLTTRPVAGLPFAVTNLYGPTECTVCSVSGRVQSVAENQDGDSTPPIGRPISNTQGYVLDRVLRPTPIGAPGELCIGGAGVARGYLGRPALTAERFVPDPFTTKPGARLYRSGDRVRWRHDGQLEFLGRLDEQVKIRGVRIEPGEVEYALRGHPRVAEAVVVACSLGGDHKSQVHLVGYVVPRDAAVLADERQFAWQAELRGFLRRRLPDYMVPSAIISVGELPLTPNGKVDRQALPVPASTWAERDHVAPRTETERRLAEMWGAFLRLPRVGRDSAFLDLGGDSLRGIQLASRIRTAFGIEFGVRDLMQASTLSEVGARIDARMNEVADASADSNAHRESEPLTDDLLTLLESVERLSDGEVTALLTNHADSLQLAKPA
jgi:amino acid adenylation domain-containing protein